MSYIIDEEIMQNHNQAEAFISLFFAGLDVITYIVILTLFGFEFKSLDTPKQKLTIFLLLDGILRYVYRFIYAIICKRNGFFINRNNSILFIYFNFRANIHR